jgi:DNA polymerase III alpha subunit
VTRRFALGWFAVTGMPMVLGAQQEPRYDVQTVGTFVGTVTAVGSHTGKRGNARTRVTIDTKAGPVELHLGPTVFLDEKKLTFAKGDQITVLGSRVKQDDGRELVIARQVTKGTQVLKLRNEEGRPLWEERHK